MTKEQKQIAEKIIHLLKRNKDNIVSKNELFGLIDEEWQFIKSIITF